VTRSKKVMPENKYIPEQYWNEVANRIKKRKEKGFLAGDDFPYNEYKRQEFLQLLNSLPFRDKKVLEVGSGPGGNLIEIYRHGPLELQGVDISSEMIALAQKNIGNKKIIIQKINGGKIDHPDKYFDLTITSTVLQHITDDETVSSLIREICRVTSANVYIFERIGRKQKKLHSNVQRTIDQYSELFEKGSFTLKEQRFLHLFWSYAFSGLFRKLFNNRLQKEGEKLSTGSYKIQKAILWVTKVMDRIFPLKADIAMLHFSRTDQ
jgi:ubiquinone/menaquinone biosynthesis C-methylase UbiE